MFVSKTLCAVSIAEKPVLSCIKDNRHARCMVRHRLAFLPLILVLLADILVKGLMPDVDRLQLYELFAPFGGELCVNCFQLYELFAPFGGGSCALC